MIGLVNTAGGSRILPSSDTVTVVILANDHVAGIVGFHPASRSVIAREGRYHARPSTDTFHIPNPFNCLCRLTCLVSRRVIGRMEPVVACR